MQSPSQIVYGLCEWAGLVGGTKEASGPFEVHGILESRF